MGSIEDLCATNPGAELHVLEKPGPWAPGLSASAGHHKFVFYDGISVGDDDTVDDTSVESVPNAVVPSHPSSSWSSAIPGYSTIILGIAAVATVAAVAKVVSRRKSRRQARGTFADNRRGLSTAKHSGTSAHYGTLHQEI